MRKSLNATNRSLVHLILYCSDKSRHSCCCYRSASVAATAAVQSIADDEANVDSASSEDAGRFEVEEVDDSSVWTTLLIY